MSSSRAKATWCSRLKAISFTSKMRESDDLLVLIVFNSSTKEPNDDIGVVHSLKAMPPDVLAAVFGGRPEMFASLPGKLDRVVIASKKLP
jgi:oxalate decarboxylase